MTGVLTVPNRNPGQQLSLIREDGQAEPCEVEAAGGGGGVVRARWGLTSAPSITFAPGSGPVYDIVTEPGTFAGIGEGDSIFFQPSQCLQGFFHSGSPAPQLAGVWLILVKLDDQEITVQRVAELTTADQFAATGLISVAEGAGAGVYQNATLDPVVVDTTPLVMPWVAKPPPTPDTFTYKLQALNNDLLWTLDP